jgi:uncharacterized integral membrane protein
MPWKMLFFVVFLVLMAVFIGFNIENTCNISIVFYTFHDVPIFMSLIFAFAIGVLVMVPFTIRRRISGKTSEKKVKPVTPTTVQQQVSVPQSFVPRYDDAPQTVLQNRSQKPEGGKKRRTSSAGKTSSASVPADTTAGELGNETAENS